MLGCYKIILIRIKWKDEFTENPSPVYLPLVIAYKTHPILSLFIESFKKPRKKIIKSIKAK
jgi:hypothetical protein